jgi:hypothetical protein
MQDLTEISFFDFQLQLFDSSNGFPEQGFSQTCSTVFPKVVAEVAGFASAWPSAGRRLIARNRARNGPSPRRLFARTR